MPDQENTGLDHQELQAARDDSKQRSAVAFDRAAGDEAEVFAIATGLMADALNQLHAPRLPVRELSLQEVAAFSIAAYGYQLLRAMWDELHFGRAAAAETMVRPAFEAADYVLACLHDNQFVELWKSRTGGRKIGRARDAAGAFVDARRPGGGRQWKQARSDTHALMQSAPHVHAKSVSNVFVRHDGAWALTPEGAYSPEIRAKGIVAARLALDLVSVVRIGFAQRLTPEWHSEMAAFSETANTQLQLELARLDAR